MWTNIFRIGELQLISWFQFLPCDADINSISDKSWKAEDAATQSVISAHVNLLNEGFLTTWTNSFVGPWDPSQGIHNPDAKIKLWLFLPGRHASVADAAKISLSKLKVVGSGTWLAPGDSEEVAIALSQALRNRIERSLRGLSYVRFGDVFTRWHSFLTTEKNSRRVQPTIEFIFSASEDALYVHAIISAKNVRGLSSSDLERVSKHCSSHITKEGLPAIVAPNGMRGRFTGCCPSDLVKQVYSSKASNECTMLGIPSQTPGCQLRGQSCYVEVTLGCPSIASEKNFDSKSSFTENTSQHHAEECLAASGERFQPNHAVPDQFPVLERTFIFPVEAVLVPILHRVYAKSSSKRLWMRNWVGTVISDAWSPWNFSSLTFMRQCLGFGSNGDIKFSDGLLIESNEICPHRNHYSRSNSNSSSISSTSSTSSDSDDAMASGTHDLDADADSFACRHSGLPSNNQLENDAPKMGSKRPRTVMTETFGQAGAITSGSIQNPYKNDYSLVETSDQAGGGLANTQVKSYWDLDDDDQGIDMDIQSLLSEFGDFGDFFVDDLLAIGEPPGTAESQAHMFSVGECGDITSGLCADRMEALDQTLLPPLGFPPYDSSSQLPQQVNDELLNISQEHVKDAQEVEVAVHTAVASSSSQFDYLAKAEAEITLASEYSAVDVPTDEFCTSIFRSPYLPKSKRVESPHSGFSAYVYSATPPSPPCLGSSEEKHETSAKAKLSTSACDMSSGIQHTKYYNHCNGRRYQIDKRSFNVDNMAYQEEDIMHIASGANLSSTVAVQKKKDDSMLEAGHLLLSLKTTLATEVECSMFQAAMCKIRHILLLCRNQIPTAINIFADRAITDHILNDSTIMPVPSVMSKRYEMKKKDSIPVRIAGDVEGMLDLPLSAPVGVWRSVGAPKLTKPSSILNAENSSSLANSTFLEEDFPNNGQRQPLHVLLDAIALLVQQATTFVDISLDTCDGDGPYDWLALEEQIRRGFSCGPSMIHAGCGGLLATCHAVDVAGIELNDPLSADMLPSSVLSLLQSDVKLALRSSFGNLDGPLSVTDWCKGHSQSGDNLNSGDTHYMDFSSSEAKDSSSTITVGGDPISPSVSVTACTPSHKDGTRNDESSQRKLNQETELQITGSRFRPTISVLPLPALLVGYQDDWLKTSVDSLKLWEKAPFEPYALPKPVTYCAICPDIEVLTSAAIDFFHQLGTVYEACKLGTHSPNISGNQMDLAPRQWSSAGLVLVDCPEPVKVEGSNTSSTSLIGDYLIALSKGWELKIFLKTLAKVLKSLRFGSNSSVNQKEGSSATCMVVYVICPFPDPTAILQTLVQSCAALGLTIFSSEKERRSLLHAQVAKALSSAAAADEASVSNVLMLSGFSVPRLVLQVVSVDLLLRLHKPGHELALLKELAFTVYNKARRISRPSLNSDMAQPSFSMIRSQSTLLHVSSPTPSSGQWKDCPGPRMSSTTITREGELDSTLRAASWDNSWQTLRTGGLSCDPNRSPDSFPQDELRCLFEPLFILAEAGAVEHGFSGVSFGNMGLESSSLRSLMDDNSSSYVQSSASGGAADVGTSSFLDASDPEHKIPSLHCCYGWTEDWHWLVCIWTDSRGELLDSQVFPFGGISSRQDTKVLQCLFVQILHQIFPILSSSSDSGPIRARDIIISRIGSFFELECQEWQKAIYSVGGNEVKKWPIQLRRSMPTSSSTNGISLQQQDMALIQERTIPSSPSPSIYSSHAKPSSYIKGGLAQTNTKKPLSTQAMAVDGSRGLFQLVQSISLVGVSIDHSLHLVVPADVSSGGGTQTSSSSSGTSSHVEGFSHLKSLGTISSSYMFIPSPSMRFLYPNPLQLPLCVTSESPPLAHLLHSKGSALPFLTGYVVSKAVPSVRRDPTGHASDEWPSILSVSLIDHYGGCGNSFQEKTVRSSASSSCSVKQGRMSGSEANNRDYEAETHLVLESVAAELHSLSWMTVSPVFSERRTALPFHCDMLLRLRRLLHYADRELSGFPEKGQGVQT